MNNKITDSFSSLLPRNINKARIVENLNIPGYPKSYWPYLPDITKINLQLILSQYNKIEYKEFKKSFKTSMLKEIRCPQINSDSNSIALVNKHTLHSLYDMMLISSSKKVLCGSADLPRKVLETFLKIAYLFTKMVTDRNIINKYQLDNGRLIIGYNYDPFPGDRKGLMPYKRFHLHLNYLDKSMIYQIENKQVYYENLSSLRKKRQLIDPTTFLTSEILYDCLTLKKYDCNFIDIKKPNPESDVKNSNPFGLRFDFKNGWQELTDKYLARFIQKFHQLFLDIYNDIYYAFTGLNYKPRIWERPKLLSNQEIKANLSKLQYLSNNTKDKLLFFSSILVDITPKLMCYLKINQHKAISNIIMGGPMYSIFLFINQFQKLSLVVNPKLFSDIGGAGLFGFDGISVVNIERGIGQLNEKQINNRDRFQKEFSSIVNNNLDLLFEN